MAVALGQDDIEDAYYPFGRHNLLEVAFLAAHLLDMRSAPQLEMLVDLVTTSAARVLGLPSYGLREGGPADLLVHDATRTVDLLARHAPPRVVIRAGRVLLRGPARASGPLSCEWGGRGPFSVVEDLDVGAHLDQALVEVLVAAGDDVDVAQDRRPLGREHRQQDADRGAQRGRADDLGARPPRRAR